MPTCNQQRCYRIRLPGKHGQNLSWHLADRDHLLAPFHTNPNTISLRFRACRTSRKDSLAFVLPSVSTFLFWYFHTAGITITINNDVMGAVSNWPIDNEANHAPAIHTTVQIISVTEITIGETWFR